MQSIDFYLIFLCHSTLVSIQNLGITCRKLSHFFLNNSPTMLERTLISIGFFFLVDMEVFMDSFPITSTRLVDSYDWILTCLEVYIHQSLVFKHAEFFLPHRACFHRRCRLFGFIKIDMLWFTPIQIIQTVTLQKVVILLIIHHNNLHQPQTALIATINTNSSNNTNCNNQYT